MTLYSGSALRWNWPHLAVLLALVPYVWLCGVAEWEPGATLTLGTLLALTWLVLYWAAAMPGSAVNGSPWIAIPIAVALGELGPYALHRWAHGGGVGLACARRAPCA